MADARGKGQTRRGAGFWVELTIVGLALLAAAAYILALLYVVVQEIL